MIVLEITNASEVVASKVGKFIEALTPDSIDHATVEAMLSEGALAPLIRLQQQLQGSVGISAAPMTRDRKNHKKKLKEEVELITRN